MPTDLTNVATLAGIVFLVLKFTSVLKYASASHWREVVTQLIVWAAGIIAIVLYANSDIGRGIVVAGGKLGDFDGASLVIIGLALGSTASVARDTIKGLDNSDSAAEPPLGGSPPAA